MKPKRDTTELILIVALVVCVVGQAALVLWQMFG